MTLAALRDLQRLLTHLAEQAEDVTKLAGSGYGTKLKDGTKPTFWWDGAHWHLGAVPGPPPDLQLHVVVIG